MIKKWLKILELKRKLKRLDKTLCLILRQPTSDKLKDEKFNIIHDEMIKIQKQIDEL
jgi:hypothetical protein